MATADWNLCMSKLIIFQYHSQLNEQVLSIKTCFTLLTLPLVLHEIDPYSEETLFSRIQSECGKMRTRKTPNMDTFYTVLTIEVHSWCHQYFCGTFSKSRLYTVNASYVNHIIEVTVSLTLVINQGESLFQVSVSYYLWRFNFRKHAYPCYSLSTPYLFVVACKTKQH